MCQPASEKEPIEEQKNCGKTLNSDNPEEQKAAMMPSKAFMVIPSQDRKLGFTDVASQMRYVQKVKSTLGYPRDVDTVTHEHMMDTTLLYSCLVTTFCFFPLGMPALIMAIDARAAMSRGDPMFYRQMRRAETLAGLALLIGLIAWGFGIIGLLFKYFFYSKDMLQ